MSIDEGYFEYVPMHEIRQRIRELWMRRAPPPQIVTASDDEGYETDTPRHAMRDGNRNADNLRGRLMGTVRRPR